MQSPAEGPQVDESQWRAWIDKGKRKDKAAIRNSRLVTMASLLIIAAIYYFASST